MLFNINACRLVTLVSTMALVATLSACTPGKRSFLTVEVCFRDAQEFDRFTSELKQIAHQQDMKFVEASAVTERDLRSVGNANVDKMLRNPLVNLGLERPDGVGLIVGNLGLPPNQVALGFTEGKNNIDDAQRFAQTVMQRLGAQWHLKVVPPDQGAVPMKDCD